MAIRTVIYARYSTDQQNPTSIETQLDLARAFAASKGWSVLGVYVDAGISGASFDTRPGLQASLVGARQREYDVLLCLSLDRLSRDLEHSARIQKILDFHDVALWTVHGGNAVSSMELGIRAVLNQEMLEQVRYRTREGMKTVAKHGRVPGNICYGYRVRKEYDPEGNPIRGLRSIDRTEAAVIVSIFRMYARGLSPDRIAESLNERGIPGPRGRAWQGTSIRGHRSRGTGVLNNELYIGRLVFNRQVYRKNPVTERRVSRVNAVEDHVVTELSALTIVSKSLWERVKRRQKHPRSRILHGTGTT